MTPNNRIPKGYKFPPRPNKHGFEVMRWSSFNKNMTKYHNKFLLMHETEAITPAQARKLADWLIRAADYCDERNKGVKVKYE